MGRKLRIVGLIFCFTALSVFLTAEISHPGPGKPYTGFDIAVVHIGTTGNSPTGPWAPTFTLKNVGSKPIQRELQMTIKSNGGLVASGPQWVGLTPGQTVEWRGPAALGSFAKIGDVVEVFIDADNKLAEDNENNNILTKKISFAMPAGAAVPGEKK